MVLSIQGPSTLSLVRREPRSQVADFGLRTAVESVIAGWGEGAAVPVEIWALPDPSSAVADEIARFVRETLVLALSAVREPGRVSVAPTVGGTVRLTVSDDGHGYSPCELPNTDDLRRRVKSLGGSLTFASEPGNGSTVSLELPADTGRAKGR